jgi:hypothetical protein
VARQKWSNLEDVTLPVDGTYVFEFDVQGEAAGAYTLRTKID